MNPAAVIQAREDAIRAWIRETELLLLNAIRRLAPRLTGKFAASMVPLVTFVGNEIVIEIRALDEHPKAVWVRDGTAPHDIFPVHAQGLPIGFGYSVFPAGTTGGDVIFSSVVHHPGTKPNLYADAALEEVSSAQIPRLAVMIEEAIAGAITR